MSIDSFYARARWGSRWGVVDAAHPTPHKGLDIRAAAGQPVPTLRTGKVVVDLPSASVGRYITVQVGPNDFDTYCHVTTVGRKGHIAAGETIGHVAGYGAPHGTAWNGPHLHVCRSRTRFGWAFWGTSNRNPEPVVLAVLSHIDTAGTDPQPFSERTHPMTATVPIKYTNKTTKKAEWARKRSTPAGGVIEKTSSNSTAGRWKQEIGYDGDSITTNASTYLERWAKECASDKASLLSLLGQPLTPDQINTLAAQIAAKVGVGLAVDIADATADELAARLAE